MRFVNMKRRKQTLLTYSKLNNLKDHFIYMRIMNTVGINLPPAKVITKSTMVNCLVLSDHQKTVEVKKTERKC